MRERATGGYCALMAGVRGAGRLLPGASPEA
jgi:hypothetical protein